MLRKDDKNEDSHALVSLILNEKRTSIEVVWSSLGF